MLLAVEVVACGQAHEDRVDHVVDEVKESGHQQAKVLAKPENVLRSWLRLYWFN